MKTSTYGRHSFSPTQEVDMESREYAALKQQLADFLPPHLLQEKADQTDPVVQSRCYHSIDLLGPLMKGMLLICRMCCTSNVSFGYLNSTKYISFLSTCTIMFFRPEMTKLIFVCCNCLPFFFADSVKRKIPIALRLLLRGFPGTHILLDTTLYIGTVASEECEGIPTHNTAVTFLTTC